MRILEVCPVFARSAGGVQHYVRNISERLAVNHEVQIFSATFMKSPRPETVNGVVLKLFPVVGLRRTYHFSPEMLREIKQGSYDVVHGHNYHALPMHYCRYAKRGKLVINPSYHGRGHTPVRDLLLRLGRPLGSKIIRDADVIVTNSRYETDLLLRDFPILPGKVKQISPGVNLGEFAKHRTIPKVRENILYVGRLEEYKGVQHIVRALPFLDKAFRLDVVGNGPYKSHLVEMASELGVRDRISYSHNLPEDQLLDMYAGAGVFVLPSQYESYSFVVAEALASGTACIVARTTALTELVNDGGCFGLGWPIRPDELASLIRAVAGIEAKGVPVRDWDDVVADFVKVYESGV
jgi:glycosyltransferase involved in cell wall biosynthesis